MGALSSPRPGPGGGPSPSASRRRNVIGHRTLRMPCATRMGHRAKASHCLISAAGLRTEGSCCDRFDGSTLECNSAVEQALSKPSLAELVRGGGHISPKYNRHGHVQSKGVTTTGRLANRNILITGVNS